MANDSKDTPLSGRDLQSSQSGGDSGEFGGNMNQSQSQPVGGGATASDRTNAGGSSGTGGYGKAQDVSLQREGQPAQGSQSGLADGDLSEDGPTQDSSETGGAASGQSRGERFDEEQGGGRGALFDGSSGVSASAEEETDDQSEQADFERESD